MDKWDLEKLQEVLRTLNADAKLTAVTQGKISEQYLENLTHLRREGGLQTEPTDPIFAKVFETEEIVNRALFLKTLEELEGWILRLKGYVNFGWGTKFVECVGGQLKENPQDAAPEPKTIFSVLPWNITPEELARRLGKTWTKGDTGGR